MKTHMQKIPGCILNGNLQHIRINHLSNVGKFVVFLLFQNFSSTYSPAFRCESAGTLLINAFANMIMQRTNEY